MNTSHQNDQRRVGTSTERALGSSGQKDDSDGEIDLKSCIKVSEFDVEKNYGFQIQASSSLREH